MKRQKTIASRIHLAPTKRLSLSRTRAMATIPNGILRPISRIVMPCMVMLALLVIEGRSLATGWGWDSGQSGTWQSISANASGSGTGYNWSTANNISTPFAFTTSATEVAVDMSVDLSASVHIGDLFAGSYSNSVVGHANGKAYGHWTWTNAPGTSTAVTAHIVLDAGEYDPNSYMIGASGSGDWDGDTITRTSGSAHSDVYGTVNYSSTSRTESGWLDLWGSHDSSTTNVTADRFVEGSVQTDYENVDTNSGSDFFSWIAAAGAYSFSADAYYTIPAGCPSIYAEVGTYNEVSAFAQLINPNVNGSMCGCDSYVTADGTIAVTLSF